jgi:hypothetical protein
VEHRSNALSERRVAPHTLEGLDSASGGAGTAFQSGAPIEPMTNCTRLAVFAVLLHLANGCGGAKEDAKAPSSDSLPLALEHERCDTESGSSQKVDTNGDGKPDIIRVLSNGREICRMVDLNHDGRADSYIYYDASGGVRRRESDFDRDGHVDEIAYYAAGVAVRKDRETNLDGKLDTWDFYQGGKIHHRMRDSDGDGKVDQWWSWPNPDKIECPVIVSDRNHDGKPDPADVVDVCSPAAGALPDAGARAPTAMTEAGAPVAAGATTTLAAAAMPEGGATAASTTTAAPPLAGGGAAGEISSKPKKGQP